MRTLTILTIILGLLASDLESKAALFEQGTYGLTLRHNTKDKEVVFKLNRKIHVTLKNNHRYIGRLTDVRADSMTLTSLKEVQRTITLAYGDLQVIQEYNGTGTRLIGPLIMAGGVGAAGLSAFLVVGLATSDLGGLALVSGLVCAGSVGVAYGGYRIWGRRCNMDRWHIQF